MFKSVTHLAFLALCLTSCTTGKSDPLNKKIVTIIKVNGYELPNTNTPIKAQFIDGKIFLIGTCNPTWGHYSIKDEFVTLSQMRNLGQTACTDLIKTDDGRINERLSTGPAVRTEDEFIALGDSNFQLQSKSGLISFIDSKGTVRVIFEE